jgi:peptidoglycan/LPS O-acetylase OafA/YrhL
MTIASRSRLGNLDVFRGLAALIVVALHTREVTWVGIREFWRLHGVHLTPNVMLGYATFPLVWGSIGVPIFFVLSGYCIHRSQARRPLHFNSTTFLVRRFFRIYPVLFGALLLTLLCDWASRHYLPNSYRLGDTSIWLFFVNLFSLQGILGNTYGSNGALWTLSIEVQFYALYPLLLVVMYRLGNVTTLAALAFFNFVSYVALNSRGYVLFSSYYASWYLGVLVAEAEAAGFLAKWIVSSKFRAFLYGFSFAILCLGCTAFFWSQYVAFQVWALAFAVFLFSVLGRHTEYRGLIAAFFRWLGAFSFSIYIVHLPAVVLIHSVFFDSVHQVSLAPFFATLILALACAYIFSLIFERPALAWSQMLKGDRRVPFQPDSA